MGNWSNKSRLSNNYSLFKGYSNDAVRPCEKIKLQRLCNTVFLI